MNRLAPPVSDPDILDPDARSHPPAVTKGEYRDAMARLGAAVTIVTTDGPAGRAGFTASAVCSVTDDPPTLLVCLNTSSSVVAAFEANGSVCVNVCSPDHRDLAMLFGGRTPSHERFAAAGWRSLASGAPVLEDAIVAFDCHVARSVDVGSHRVFFCEVDAIAARGRPAGLIYFDRTFHALPL